MSRQGKKNCAFFTETDVYYIITLLIKIKYMLIKENV